MPQYNPASSNHFRFPNNEPDMFKDRYIEPSSYVGNLLPKQIIPRQPAAHLLNQMAYKASQKYDHISNVPTPTIESISNVRHEVNEPVKNSEVLFFPGSENSDCNENVASKGE